MISTIKIQKNVPTLIHFKNTMLLIFVNNLTFPSNLHFHFILLTEFYPNVFMPEIAQDMHDFT